ncbi:MAG TPA: DUF6125 family protein [Verrucomicrobiae bacterium]|nr:DUF6125 family protein [Verrucomicrobiae bacterium]
MEQLKALSREQLENLVVDFAKRWLAHDGLWFQAVEQGRGMDEAIKYDAEAWEKFTVIEAKRIMEFLRLPPGGGLEALEQALKYRLYAVINLQETERVNAKTLVFKMTNCRVQFARNRKGLPDFPCKPVGLVEYANFARTIDSRIKTRCIACPPDEHSAEFYCAWEFTLED